MDRCPTAVMRGVEDFFDAWIAQESGDGWPSEGSPQAQSAWYCKARDLARLERHKIEKASESARKRAAEMFGR